MKTNMTNAEQPHGDKGARMDSVEVEIRPFTVADAPAFRALNEDWIKEYFDLEEEDRLVLNDPVAHILRLGGHIFMAFVDEVAIGCCCLIAMQPGVFKLAKMTVATPFRGKGIGRKILAYTIDKAKSLGAIKLFLASNTRLEDAIHLYEAYGFRHLKPEDAPSSSYVRANVFMELHL
jgi:putative acetyltransferase